jgi:hypothetical protein
MGTRDVRILIAAAAWLGGATGALAASACSDGSVALRGEWGQARFNVELADDPQERAVGLMNRASMPASSGMLFVYEAPVHATFWMRNTLIPLDMIFIGPDGVVRHVHENAVPLDETVIDGGRGVLAVLEINGGMAGALGIAPGTEVRHPAFAEAGAAWPCGD